jgi:hypothetical protein
VVSGGNIAPMADRKPAIAVSRTRRTTVATAVSSWRSSDSR